MSLVEPSPVEAVVLAGGLGTRLAPYTTVFPKPLMPVGGRPILELVLRRLRRQGISRVTLAVGHLEELIRAFFGSGERVGVELSYYREERPLGTVGALALLDNLAECCLVMNGDVLTTIDVRALLARHRQENAAMTVVTQPRTVRIDYGVLEIDARSRVAGYREKPVLEYEVSAGVNVIGAAARQLLVPGEPCDIPTLVERLLSKGQVVAAYRSDAYWRDIGRPADYEAVNEEFEGLRGEFGL